jgi:uncharacterized surface protein with fasciclin (FAS1) repeats
MPMRRSLSAVAAVVALAIAGCGSSKSGAVKPAAIVPTTATTVPAVRNVAQLAAYDAQLSTFATMLNVSGVLTSLGAHGPYTIFAPTNGAFAKVAHAHLNALLSPAGKQELSRLIRDHVVRGRLLARDLKQGPLETLGGATLTLTVHGRNITLTEPGAGTATVVSGALVASNGVIYRTDAVLTHP